MEPRSDAAHKQTDAALAEMEQRIREIYSRAAEELQKTADEYFAKFENQDKAKRTLLESGKITEEEYKKWRKGKIMYGKRFEAMKKECAEQLLNANKTALAYINNQLPEVYTINYNALEGAVDGVGGYSFALVDANTVRRLAAADDSFLPIKELDPVKDVAWNMQKINSETLQGILQGESVDKIAERIINVQEMNRVSANRTARTIVTGAECKGREDSYKRASEDGIKLRRKWIATSDARTRDWHHELDGKMAEVGEPFVNSAGEIMYPGDPSAAPANVYNCRCTTAAVVLGFGQKRRK